MSTFSKIRDYQKSYGFFKALSILLKRKRDSKKAKKDMEELIPILDIEYSPLIEKYKDIKVNDTIPKRIFFFWYDGISKMPDIVSMCYKQIQKLYCDGYEILFIDKDNYKKFLNIDNMFIDALNNKNITIQTFSDILRFYLMNQLGGIWIDATIYLPYKIDFIRNSYDGFYTLNTTHSADFFSYQNKSCCWSGFLTGTSKDHPISECMIELFKNYLIKNKTNSIYFLIDIFFMLVYKNNIAYSCIDVFSKKNILDYDFLFLSNNLSKKSNDELLKRATLGPQKLNWRINIEKYKKDSLINVIMNKVKINEI